MKPKYDWTERSAGLVFTGHFVENVKERGYKLIKKVMNGMLDIGELDLS